MSDTGLEDKEGIADRDGLCRSDGTEGRECEGVDRVGRRAAGREEPRNSLAVGRGGA